ncbi:hypothetical protein ACFSJ3_04185 [Corallincola platygyrae]|uniref:Uncharacterized protein n=1 Tax=Corallincola platygyrae TaxID=1193278 RepID=A0ABW4XJ98_9GAMM
MKIPKETSEEQFEFEMIEMRQAVKGERQKQRQGSLKDPMSETPDSSDIDEQAK